MIAKMQQVTIAARKSDARRLISALQDAGVLHITPVETQELSTGALTGQDAEDRKNTERLLARVDTTLGELGNPVLPSGPLPAEANWVSTVEAVAKETGVLTHERTALESDLSLAQSFADVVKALAEVAQGLDASRRLSVIPFTLDAKQDAGLLQQTLQSDLKDRFAMDFKNVGNLRAGVVVVKNQDRDVARQALSRARVGELRLPGRFDGMPLGDAAREMDRVNREAPGQIQRIRDQVNGLAHQHGSTLAAIRDALRDRVTAFEVQVQSARGRYGMVLQGFVPADNASELQNALKQFDVAVEMQAADEHHAENVPVKLKNNSFVQNFEFLLNVSQPPKYGTFDPSWIVTVFFPLFFGFVIADIGLGLLFLALSIWAMGQARAGKSITIGFMGIVLDPKTLKNVATVLTTMSVWAILWGFLTGEFFGNFFEHLGIFYIDPALTKQIWGVTLSHHAEAHHAAVSFPILYPRVDSAFATTVMLHTLFMGIIFLLWSWGLKAQVSFKHGHASHGWEGLGMVGGLIGLVLLAWISEAGKNFGALGNVLGDWRVLVMLLGFLIFLIGVFRSGVYLMFMEILSQGGNIISFSRLFAVGLASALLANLATDVGWGMYKSMGFIGAILGVVAALLVHAFAIALTIIGHVMQPLRLNYVEFLNPTGFYTETGPRYNPLRKLSRQK
ncbi:V-type ATP synthase subunit I [Deinococcus cellulosilyticus]|uniref:V-type ATP synthase subunit I n=1 Tax=Deinococcus cellulosilyticus (strain DSM 18568 / NBRC 106333 / KACC 11606 / 5516J-15) TaxID=1223518 RepID=A0A511MZ16_DEIC1|nr:V-type ATPase 116kDa subunit family protein [Deinococcus cellulosilyticus]GEM45860.1 v-type ATP synthase subunit I [Deinococcus cellulosilyticus NBRC 106333 = KACC 11606]